MRPKLNSDAVFPSIVIGLGPAGAAALSEFWRHGMFALGIGDEPVGGLLWAARRIENLPALGRPVSGAALAARLSSHLQERAVETVRTRIARIEHAAPGYACHDEHGRMFFARTVVVASGTRPAPWQPFPAGGRAHRDIRTLPRRLVGKTVIVVGGGEAALDTALTAAERGARVEMLVRGDALKAPPPLAAEARRAGIRVLFHTRVLCVAGENNAIRVETVTRRARRTRRGDHLLVCTGRIPARELVSTFLPASADELPIAAPAPGLFLAGDVRGRTMRFCVQALADGQAAALLACAYLKEASHV